jgi:hypothetical protein
VPYSARLAAASTSATGITELFTADDAYVTVLRDIVVTNLSGAAVAYSLYVATSPGPLDVYLSINTSLANDGADHWEGRQIMYGGESLYVSGGGHPLTVLVSGYLLSSP